MRIEKLLFYKKEKIEYNKYKFNRRVTGVENVLLHTLWVKRNAGRGTPASNSSVKQNR